MSEIVQFEFGFSGIRVVVIESEPWLVAKDVCDALEIGNVSKACERLDEDEKGITTSDTLGGNQDMLIISESGFYRLVMTSRKPSVKKFQKWVTSEVIPSIRKTGRYSTEVPQIPAYIENVQIAQSIRTITDTLDDNPRLAQFLIDQTIDRCFGQKTIGIPIVEPPIKGVAEIAESMGLPVNHKNRSALGRYISSLGIHEQLKEDRLCNGQIRTINCYRVTDAIKSDINTFFS